MGTPRLLLALDRPGELSLVRRVDNPYFPLKPGARFHFVGHKGATRQVDNEVVTHRTKRILGIRSTVVRDTVLQNGKPIERTFDWYAQDKHGNVWYIGEDSLELKHGHFVRASDSWKSGGDGAKPGIIMRGHPRRGDVYRQEYLPPDALDQARVLGTQGAPDGPGTERSSDRSPRSSGAPPTRSSRRRTTRAASARSPRR